MDVHAAVISSMASRMAPYDGNSEVHVSSELGRLLRHFHSFFNMAGRSPSCASFNPLVKVLDSNWGIPLNDSIEDVNKRHGWYFNRAKFNLKVSHSN
jgi:hypothetical protein